MVVCQGSDRLIFKFLVSLVLHAGGEEVGDSQSITCSRDAAGFSSNDLPRAECRLDKEKQFITPELGTLGSASVRDVSCFKTPAPRPQESAYHMRRRFCRNNMGRVAILCSLGGQFRMLKRPLNKNLFIPRYRYILQPSRAVEVPSLAALWMWMLSFAATLAACASLKGSRPRHWQPPKLLARRVGRRQNGVLSIL